jgi:hypothetical protein
MTGDLEEMQRWLSESRKIFIELDDRWGVGLASLLLGVAVDALGDRKAGEALSAESIHAFEACGDRLSLGLALNSAGEIPRGHGDYVRATKLYEEGLALCREAGNHIGTVMALTNLGMTQSLMGEHMRAEFRLRESLTMCEELGLLSLVPVCLLGLSGIATERGDLRLGARLLGASLATQEALGGHYHPADQAYFEATFETLRSRLGQDERTSEIKRGEALTLPEAIALGHRRIELPGNAHH